jgi:hypothetical protein
MNVFVDLQELGFNGMHTPICTDLGVTKLPSGDVNDLLKLADGKSLINPVREGMVWKSTSRNFSFKTISNKFLLGGGE